MSVTSPAAAGMAAKVVTVASAVKLRVSWARVSSGIGAGSSLPPQAAIRLKAASAIPFARCGGSNGQGGSWGVSVRVDGRPTWAGG